MALARSRHGERVQVGQAVGDLIPLAGLADGGVEVGQLLGLALGFEDVADGAEAAGLAIAVVGRGQLGGVA